MKLCYLKNNTSFLLFLSSVTITSVFRYTSNLVSYFKAPVICHRSSSAAEEESFENDLEQRLEDELKLEELIKHRQEPDKSCMVSSSFPGL